MLDCGVSLRCWTVVLEGGVGLWHWKPGVSTWCWIVVLEIGVGTVVLDRGAGLWGCIYGVSLWHWNGVGLGYWKLWCLVGVGKRGAIGVG